VCVCVKKEEIIEPVVGAHKEVVVTQGKEQGN